MNLNGNKIVEFVYRLLYKKRNILYLRLKAQNIISYSVVFFNKNNINNNFFFYNFSEHLDVDLEWISEKFHRINKSLEKKFTSSPDNFSIFFLFQLNHALNSKR